MPSPPVETQRASAQAEANLGPLRGKQVWIASWGVLGVLLLFGQAVWRLGNLSWEALNMPLSSSQVVLCLFWVLINAYGEGYRAFQLRFSPRVVRRAHELARNPNPLAVLLAPLYCMNLIGAARRTLMIAWLSVVLIAGAVAVVRQLSQPYRGLVDAGVVVALIWGMAAMVTFHARALRTGVLPVVAERRRRRSEAPAGNNTTEHRRPEPDPL